MGYVLEIFIAGFLLLFMVVYRMNTGDNFYKFISKAFSDVYNKYAPYSFKMVREKTKELGQEYTTRQYIIQIAIFAGGAGIIS